LGSAEVTSISGMYERVAVLEGAAATAAKVLDAIDGCALAHIAAHGTFRADSPLFSSLRMDDGPLTVHDFERLGRAPYRLVLPSCDSARLAAAGADELLGLAAALVPLGTAGIVASVVPVNDAATAELMLDFHQALRRGATMAGATMAGALQAVRLAAGADPLYRATAWSFVALGAA
jgi:CHAT domain-containing protein